MLYAKISRKAAQVTLELGELIREESLKHLETIRDICEVSMKFQQDEKLFLENLDQLRPQFTTSLLAFLNFAIDEESANLRRRGINPNSLPSVWLKVLQVVKQGV